MGFGVETRIKSEYRCGRAESQGSGVVCHWSSRGVGKGSRGGRKFAGLYVTAAVQGRSMLRACLALCSQRRHELILCDTGQVAPSLCLGFSILKMGRMISYLAGGPGR